MDCLSHIGLTLERMLGFIHTKNKVVADERILMVSPFFETRILFIALLNRKDMMKIVTWSGRGISHLFG